jgi:hypothetical protein
MNTAIFASSNDDSKMWAGTADSATWLMAFRKLPSLGFLMSLQAVRNRRPEKQMRKAMRMNYPPKQDDRSERNAPVEEHSTPTLVDFDFKSQ